MPFGVDERTLDDRLLEEDRTWLIEHLVDLANRLGDVEFTQRCRRILRVVGYNLVSTEYERILAARVRAQVVKEVE